jgi:hypothetical protein
MTTPSSDDGLGWLRQIQFRDLLTPTLVLTISNESNGTLITTVSGYTRKKTFDQHVRLAIGTALNAQRIATFSQPPALLSQPGRLSRWRGMLGNFAARNIGLQAYSREALGVLRALGSQTPQITAEQGVSGLITITLKNIRLPANFIDESEKRVRENYNNWQGRIGELIPSSPDEVFLLSASEKWDAVHNIGAISTHLATNNGANNVHQTVTVAPVSAPVQQQTDTKRKLDAEDDQDVQHKAQKQFGDQTPRQGLAEDDGSNVQANKSAISMASTPLSHTSYSTDPRPSFQNEQGLKRKFPEQDDQILPQKAQRQTHSQTAPGVYSGLEMQAKKSTAYADAAPLAHTSPLSQPNSAPSGSILGANNPVQQTTESEAELTRPGTTSSTHEKSVSKDVSSAKLGPAPSTGGTENDPFADVDDDDLFGDGDSLFGEEHDEAQSNDHGKKQTQNNSHPGLALPPRLPQGLALPPRAVPGLALPRTIAQIPPPVREQPQATSEPLASVPIPATLSSAESQEQQNRIALAQYRSQCFAQGVNSNVLEIERINKTKPRNAPKSAQDNQRLTLDKMIRWCARGQLERDADRPNAKTMRNFLKAGPKEWSARTSGKGFGKQQLEERLRDLHADGSLGKCMEGPDGMIVLDPRKTAASSSGLGPGGVGAQQQYATSSNPQSYAPPLGYSGYIPQGQTPMANNGYTAPPPPSLYGATYGPGYGTTVSQSVMPIAHTNQAAPVSSMATNDRSASESEDTTPQPAPTKKSRKSRAKATSDTPKSPRVKKVTKKQLKASSTVDGMTPEAREAYQTFLLKNNGGYGMAGEKVDVAKDAELNALARQAAAKLSPQTSQIGRRDSGVEFGMTQQAYAEDEDEEL